MREYIVSLIILTDKSIDNPQTLSKKLKLNEVIFEKKPWAKNREPKKGTYWILSSDLEDNLPIENHLQYIKDFFPADFIIKPCDFILDVYISIGLFNNFEETGYCSLLFPPESLMWFFKFYELLSLDITIYSGDYNQDV